MSNPMEKYPIVKTALSRIGHQYSDSDKFRAFVTATVEPLIDLQTVFLNISDIDLDTAKGIKLDLIARLVGAPAYIPRAIPQQYFGYEGQEMSDGFGELDDPEAGGFWREMGQQSNLDWNLPASILRKSVLAQIAKNKSKCTPNDIIKVAKIILGNDVEFKYLDGQMVIILLPKMPILMKERELLKALIPRPAGVSFIIINNKYDAIEITDNKVRQEIFDENYY